MYIRLSALKPIALLALLHAYIGWRLLPSLPIGTLGVSAACTLLLASCVLIPLGFTARMITSQPLSDRVAWIGMLDTGFFSTLLVSTLIRDIVLLVIGILPVGRYSQAIHAESAMLVIAASVLATVAGLANARRRAQVVEVDIPLRGLPAALHGFSIAQISDVHVGSTIKRGYLDAIVNKVNSLRPDLIAITGDMVDGTVAQLAAHTAPLARLAARHGTYFVTGNHEYYSGARSWIDELRRLGLTVLLNQHVVVKHGGSELIVAGVTDHGAHHFDAAQRSDSARATDGAPAGAAARILLAHQPRTASAAESAGFDLQLSGHTHGGQFWPWNLLVRFYQPFTAGLHRINRLWVYVSRGTGYWGPPNRLGAPSEITRLRLVPALAAAS